jgi:AdoMet-dependent rRNA methyltransferase SPB1
VLGKGDFKALLKWRLALREEVSLNQNRPISDLLLITLQPKFGLDNKIKTTEELTEIVEIAEELDEEQQISEEV